MCHARERKHPERHDATRLAFVALDDLPAYVAASSCPHGWIPAFAEMTRVGFERRDAAVVSRRRLIVSIPLSHRIPENLSLRNATLRCCLGPLPGRNVVVLKGDLAETPATAA